MIALTTLTIVKGVKGSVQEIAILALEDEDGGDGKDNQEVGKESQGFWSSYNDEERV